MSRNALFFLLLIVAATAHATDTPETVYQTFHAAAAAKNYAEAAKHASSFTGIVVREGEAGKMPLRALIPKAYRVLSTQISPDGQSATLLLEGHYDFPAGPSSDAKGRIGLVKERGQWKVDSGGWSSR